MPLVMLITWLDFGGILLKTFFLPNFFLKFRTCFFAVRHCFGRIFGMVCWIDMKRKGSVSIGCRANYVTLTFDLIHDLDLEFSRSNLEITVSQEWLVWLMWNKKEVNRLDAGPTIWSWSLTTPMTLTSEFQGQILKQTYHRNGRADWHGMKTLGVDHSWSWQWPVWVKHGGVGGCTGG